MSHLIDNYLVGLPATGSDQRVRGKQMEDNWAEGWEACEGGITMNQDLGEVKWLMSQNRLVSTTHGSISGVRNITGFPSASQPSFSHGARCMMSSGTFFITAGVVIWVALPALLCSYYYSNDDTPIRRMADA